MEIKADYDGWTVDSTSNCSFYKVQMEAPKRISDLNQEYVNISKEVFLLYNDLFEAYLNQQPVKALVEQIEILKADLERINNKIIVITLNNL